MIKSVVELLQVGDILKFGLVVGGGCFWSDGF